MQSTFRASDSGQAMVQNATASGNEQLIVTLHPGTDSSAHIQIREDVAGGVVSASISINQSNLQKLVDWLRDQGTVD